MTSLYSLLPTGLARSFNCSSSNSLVQNSAKTRKNCLRGNETKSTPQVKTSHMVMSSSNCGKKGVEVGFPGDSRFTFIFLSRLRPNRRMIPSTSNDGLGHITPIESPGCHSGIDWLSSGGLISNVVDTTLLDDFLVVKYLADTACAIIGFIAESPTTESSGVSVFLSFPRFILLLVIDRLSRPRKVTLAIHRGKRTGLTSDSFFFNRSTLEF
mmetsp:Transcript_882/g.1075  ORF Transcript_882/g.1075 Transcript_882/m.1075 type:complete len:212 (-) Transcript_882:365-1000(-)